MSSLVGSFVLLVIQKAASGPKVFQAQHPSLSARKKASFGMLSFWLRAGQETLERTVREVAGSTYEIKGLQLEPDPPRSIMLTTPLSASTSTKSPFFSTVVACFVPIMQGFFSSRETIAA